MELIVKKNERGEIHCDDGPAMIDTDHHRFFKNGRLHREDGPAVEYFNDPDSNLYILEGVGLCSEGFSIAKKIVMTPKELTVDEIFAIKNEEIRRIAIERFGTEEFLHAAKAEVVDLSHNDIENTEECIFKCKDFMYFCGVCVSTGRVYYIEIPNTIVNCDEAREFLSSGKKVNQCIGAS